MLRQQKLYKNPDSFEGFGHGEIIAHPDLMAKEIEAFLRRENER